MTINNLLAELNPAQRKAATTNAPNTLVLAGAGSGKTKTIVARAAYLISQGAPANEIQIVTFTRRAASEIVSRVENHLGAQAEGLRASTFHTFCLSILRRYPKVFGLQGFNVIDRDDQIMMFKLLRGKLEDKRNSQITSTGKTITFQNRRQQPVGEKLPKAKELADLYSYARNTQTKFEDALYKQLPDYQPVMDEIKLIMAGYQKQKQERHYLDYDDILEYVAKYLNADEWLLEKVTQTTKYLLVDEMQDTNPLQWLLLQPFIGRSQLFCVGDDAQSIYGFRGADFQNIHSFKQRVPDAQVLTLDLNYRSTQEILDLSNWLLDRSELDYKKRLTAHRGEGIKPVLHSFGNEFDEARFIVSDLKKRYDQGAPWHHHMILLRSAFSGRQVESALIAANIPYVFIGGTKLLEAAHVKDLISMLRVSVNYLDELAWIRFLTLWDGIGDAGAGKLVNEFLSQPDLTACIDILDKKSKVPKSAIDALKQLSEAQRLPEQSIDIAFAALHDQLQKNYEKRDWEARVRDFDLVKQLARRHDTLADFIEAYILEPISHSEVTKQDNEDMVTLITIHSAKGAEREVCYIINASVGQYPHMRAQDSFDEVEEERRVLYVAMTRAKDELIITRQNLNTWATSRVDSQNRTIESYFLSEVPTDLLPDDAGMRSFTDRRDSFESHRPLRNRPVIGLDLGDDLDGIPF
ncbi:ATP-dependent DNA helicase UvrD/PcrA, proteobacterial paralog [Enhydrobacter sp. AX1]|nr:ATP-dependent helicase [Enhydrobacter sp. AX1]VXB60342.1 ATP-dependent DNA helicase UvrD/PcrA, proteobacterial paralog [Enhydrobacter sp. AX1]